MKGLEKRYNYFKILLISISTFWNADLFAQNLLSPDQAKEDVAYLYKKLQKLHPGLYRYQDSTAYAQEYQNLYNSFDAPVNYLDFYRRMAPLITDIKDLHTSYGHSPSWLRKNNAYFPVLIREYDQKYYVNYNCSNDSSMHLGDQILKIEGEKMYDVVEDLKNLYGTDNGNYSNKNYYAVRSFSPYFTRKYGAKDSIKIEIMPIGTDTVREVKISTLKQNQVLKNLQKKYPDALRKNVSYKLLDSASHAAKLDILSFVKMGSPFDFFQLSFKRNLKKSFRAIKKDSVDNLMLDLRANGGGYVPNVGRLMKYLATEPFKLIDSMSFKKQAFFKIFPPFPVFPPLIGASLFKKYNKEYFLKTSSKPGNRKPTRKNHYDGKLWVLMDGGSYSATTFTIGMLKDMNRATFSGERPGGANWGSFAGKWYIARLPNSGIRVRIPYFKMVHYLPHKTNQSFFVEPDIPAKTSYEDFLKRKDTLQNLILKQIKSEKNAEENHQRK